MGIKGALTCSSVAKICGSLLSTGTREGAKDMDATQADRQPLRSAHLFDLHPGSPISNTWHQLLELGIVQALGQVVNAEPCARHEDILVFQLLAFQLLKLEGGRLKVITLPGKRGSVAASPALILKPPICEQVPKNPPSLKTA